MAVYKITSFAASDMDKVGEITESIRDLIESVGADLIDLVSYRNGKGVVILGIPIKQQWMRLLRLRGAR